jgi:putative transposase
MLTEREFNAWCEELGLPSATIELIQKIRGSPPSRRVGGGRDNVPVSYPSRKMGFTVQSESHRVEFPLVYQLENDDDVLEYYCQPAPIELEYEGASGRHVVAHSTPDYFVLRRKSAGWIEVKDENQLPILAAKSPNRYQFVENRWECPPGKAYAARFHLCYDLHSSADISPTFVRNATFLDDYLRVREPVPSVSIEAVRACLAETPIVTLEYLLSQTKDAVPSDEIYQMIAGSIIHVNLNAAPLIEPERVRVFANSEAAAQFYAGSMDDLPNIGMIDICPGAVLSWDGKPWTVLNIGNHNLTLRGENDHVSELPISSMELLLQEGRLLCVGGTEQLAEHSEVERRCAVASKSDLETANKRCKLVEAYLNPQTEEAVKDPNRTLRRYISRYLEARDAYGNGYIGLLPQVSKQGNRTARLTEETRLEMEECIESIYEKPEQPTKFCSWVEFKDACKSQNLPWVSYWTFCKAVDARPLHTQTEKRKGRRAAYKHKEFYWNLDRQTPRHGDRPFEIGHIDHTELDLEIISPVTGKKLGKLWLTILTDAFSRRELAHSVSFEEPSYRSCMMVFRECVRRHGRLPQIIVIDGGHEFASTYFDYVLARFEITKKTRPPAQSRFGSVCERHFGTTNTQFIHNLRGNTQIMKNVRQVTKSNNPKNRAIWDCRSFDDRLTEYFDSVYDTMEHPALGQNPRDAFNAGLDLGGPRKHRYILYNHDFLMATAPSTQKGTAKVHPGRGVTINHFLYWCQAFRDPLVENHSVPVRYDPYDMGVAWAFVRGHWMECHSQFYSDLKGRSEKEVRLAATKIRKQMHEYSQSRTTITASQQAAFLRKIHQDEEMLLQRLRDQEIRSLREGSGSTAREEKPNVPETSENQVASRELTRSSFEDLELCGAL